MKKLLFPVIIVVVTVLSGCTKDDSVVTSSAKNYLTLWNPCEAVTVLQEYVEDVTNPSSKNFIKKEDRIVTFDMDGTFVGEPLSDLFRIQHVGRARVGGCFV